MNESMSRVLSTEEYNTKAIWKTYGYWAFLVAIVFFSVYPLCNWITSQRLNVYHLYLSEELSMPFIPSFFWIYMSLYLLFIIPPFFLGVLQLEILGKRIVLGTLISGIIFLIFPTQLGFERIVPEGFYAKLFTNIFALDLPHNMAPSLHVVYSSFILLAIYKSSSKKIVHIITGLWLVLIMASTIFVHQHHLIDIVLAIAITLLVSSIFIKGEKNV
jgi:hypothetical protein